MRGPTDPHRHTTSHDAPATEREGDATIAIFIGPRRTRPATVADRLERLFVEWAWSTRHADWMPAVRTLAQALKGLEGAGLVERRRVRDAHGRPLHLLELTPLGRSALALLSGDGSETTECPGCEAGQKEKRQCLNRSGRFSWVSR